MATTISRTWYDTLQDDSGGGTDGTIIDKADFDAILDAIDALLAGNLVFGGSLTIAGALTGVTALTMSGALTGATQLSATGGTVTASTPVVTATQTWNSGGVTFTGLKLNVTDTASAAASLLADLQVGGVSKFKVTKAGQVLVPDGTAAVPSFGSASNPDTGLFFRAGPDGVGISVNGTTYAFWESGQFTLHSSGGSIAFSDNPGISAADLTLARAAARVFVLGPTTGVRFNWATADAFAIQNFAGTAGAQVTVGAFALVNKLTPAALPSGNTNDWNPGTVADNGFLVAEANAAGSTLTGIVATNVVSGKIYILQNLGSGTLTLATEDAGSTAANRFRAAAATFTIPAGGACFIAYDGSRWNVMKAN